NDPSSQTATTARTWRRLISAINKPDDLSQNILFRMEAASSYIFPKGIFGSETHAAHSGPLWGIAMANAGIVGLDWQQRINWDRLRKYRTERARERMKAHGLGAMLLMYDENVRYVTGTLTPGWNRLKPGLRYAMLCGDDPPILFEQGDIGFQIER